MLHYDKWHAILQRELCVINCAHFRISPQIIVVFKWRKDAPCDGLSSLHKDNLTLLLYAVLVNNLLMRFFKGKYDFQNKWTIICERTQQLSLFIIIESC